MSQDSLGPMGRDEDYLSRREAQERLAAEQSADLAARSVHNTLADMYAARRGGDVAA